MNSSTQLLLLCALVGVVYTCTNTYCWTRWFDRDNPSLTGDWETLHNFNKAQVCPRPVGIECQTTSGQPYQSTGIRITILCMLQKLLSARACAARDEVIWIYYEI